MSVRQRKWTEDEIDYLCLAFEDGESTTEEVANFLDRSVRSVWGKLHLLKQAGVLETREFGGWTHQEEEVIVKYYNKVPNKVISEMLERRVADIVRKANRMNLGQKRIIDYEELKTLAEKGYTRRQIANKLNVHYKSVIRFSKKHNIEIVKEENNFGRLPYLTKFRKSS